MPRLRFELTPINRDEQGRCWRTREENDAWVREMWAKWKRPGDPTPCDCGFYADGWLELCDARARVGCRANVATRLEEHHRHIHLDGLKKKREFPGLGRAPKDHCSWCKQPLVHGRVYQRSMHDGRLDEPECRWAYEVHTRAEVQKDHLLDRDGRCCRRCGERVGGWAHSPGVDLDKVREWGSSWARAFPAAIWVGPYTSARWACPMEVDHVIALAVAYEAFPDDARRRWFFGPANLQLLCERCHKAKTVQDRALLRQAYLFGEEWARGEVLRRLSDAGLLRGARPKGAT